MIRSEELVQSMSADPVKFEVLYFGDFIGPVVYALTCLSGQVHFFCKR